MITKLLIANRGEIARRIIRTAREMGIATAAVYSDPDADAPFVAEADEAVRLPGAAASHTYLRGEAIIDAAGRTGATAVHPGYGFLSEDSRFAQACADASLVFVGPPVKAIQLMGSKVSAKRLMADAGVPVLPGFTVDDAMSEADAAAEAIEIGFPVLVKAAFGGGGRGMRSVFGPADLAEAITGARREAAAAFGNGLVFLERLVVAPRHIEVQVFADRHGAVVSLFERECSIQRRHQKVIEEAPSTAVDEALRTELGMAAVSAARAIGFVGAGTVEFVLDTTSGRFAFLEMNTRLQVEHPVTEAITGLDLVRLQLEVADGQPLDAAARDARRAGHAVEARLYAEDVPGGFVPSSGTFHRFRIPIGPGVRVDAGYEDGSVVSTHYDAMLAKVVAWAPTRPEATAKLAAALARAELHGPVTNRDLLVRTLRHPNFGSGATDTGFYERHDPTGPGAELGASLASDDTHDLHAVAAVIAAVGTRPDRGRPSPVPAGIPAGWRNVGPRHQPVIFELPGGRRIEVTEPSSAGRLLGLHHPEAGIAEVVVEVDGVRRSMRVHRVGSTHFVDSVLGSSVLEEVPVFADIGNAAAVGSLVAPLPGSVIEVLVGVDDEVTAGQVVVTMEAMKMRHAVRAPLAGTVRQLRVTVGQQVDKAAVLIVVEPGNVASTDP